MMFYRFYIIDVRGTKMKDLLKRILPVSKKAFENQMDLLNRKLFETQNKLTVIKKMS